MKQYKIKEVWTIKQQYEEAQIKSWLELGNCYEAFKKLADEEQQTLAGHAFCEGLKERSVATLVATEARNSAARAVRIAPEAIAVNTKVIDKKRQSRQGKSSKKALVGVSSSYAGTHSYSFDGPDSPFASEHSRSSVHSDSEDADCMVGPPAEMQEGEGERISEENKREKGVGGRQLTRVRYAALDVGELVM